MTDLIAPRVGFQETSFPENALQESPFQEASFQETPGLADPRTCFLFPLPFPLHPFPLRFGPATSEPADG
jgi:hypothetical protein